MVEALRKGEVSFVSGLTALQAQALESEDDIHVNHAVGKRFAGPDHEPRRRGQERRADRRRQPGTEGSAGAHRDPARDRPRRPSRSASTAATSSPTAATSPRATATTTGSPRTSEVIGYDPDEANRILDEAGYEPGDDGIRVSPDGVRLTLRQFVHADDPEYRQIATFMEEWLAEIGIEVETTPSDDIGGILDSGEFDLLFTGWTVNPDPDYIFSIQTCGVRPAEARGVVPVRLLQLQSRLRRALRRSSRPSSTRGARRGGPGDAEGPLRGRRRGHLRLPRHARGLPHRRRSRRTARRRSLPRTATSTARTATGAGGRPSRPRPVAAAVAATTTRWVPPCSAVGAGVRGPGLLGGFLLMRRRSATRRRAEVGPR